jgi:ribokinase
MVSLTGSGRDEPKDGCLGLGGQGRRRFVVNYALDVAVVGVANIDLVTRVPEVAHDGETTFGTSLLTRPGGKGLNQAIGVVDCGGRAALVSQAGDDPWGRLLLDALRDRGIDATAFRLVPGGRTAAVLIQVPSSGDAAVTVTRTDITLHSAEDIDRARSILRTAPVSVVQLELEPGVIEVALGAAGGMKIGTLAPRQPLPPALYSALDMIVVNEAEARVVLGWKGTGLAGPGLAEAIVGCGPGAAVVTLGARGAAYSDGVSTGTVDGVRVRVRDTTGAGDSFLGAVALTMARGGTVAEAAQAGNIAGSRAVGH